MSNVTFAVVILVYTALPLLAVALSFAAKSAVVRVFLRYGGLYYLLFFLCSWVFNFYCDYNDFQLVNCKTIPMALAEIYNTMQISILVYWFIVPLLVIFAAGWEFYVRKKAARFR